LKGYAYPNLGGRKVEPRKAYFRFAQRGKETAIRERKVLSFYKQGEKFSDWVFLKEGIRGSQEIRGKDYGI